MDSLGFETGARKKSGMSSVVFFPILGVIIGLGFAGIHYWDAYTLKRERRSRSSLETSRDMAFSPDRQPKRTGPAREIFSKQLPKYVITLNDWLRRPSQESLERVHGASTSLMVAAQKAALAEDVIKHLEKVLIAAREAGETMEDLDAFADRLTERTMRLNDALLTANLGFFVDSTVQSSPQGRGVLLFTFEVYGMVLHRVLGIDVRTLRVRRLDNLNWTYNFLGFTSPERRIAFVLDNKVEEFLLRILPALPGQTTVDPMDLPLEDWKHSWFELVLEQANLAIREELGQFGDHNLVVHLGDLLAQREQIFNVFREALSKRRLSLDIPTSLDIEWNYRGQMAGVVSTTVLDDLDDVQEELLRADILAAYASVHDGYVRSVERHEVQHRLDLANVYQLPMPPELARYVGELPKDRLGTIGLASAALAETSAYLSELARDVHTPRLNLTHVFGFLLDRRQWGTGESYAALVIVEGLAEELDLRHGELVMNRQINREECARLYVELCQVPSDVLRGAAATLWQRYFERPLPDLEVIVH